MTVASLASWTVCGAAARDVACPSRYSGLWTTMTPSGIAARTESASWPTTTISSSTSAARSASIACRTSGAPSTSTSCLVPPNREPVPAASTIPEIIGGAYVQRRSAGFGAGAWSVVDRAGSFLEEAASSTVPHRHDLRNDRLRDLVGSLGAEVETRRSVDPRALLVGDLDAVLGKIHQDPLR